MAIFEERLKEGDGTLVMTEWESLAIDSNELFDKLEQEFSTIEKLKVSRFNCKNYLKAQHFVGAMAFEPPVPLKLAIKSGEDRLQTMTEEVEEDKQVEYEEIELKQIIIKPKIGWTDFISMLGIAYNVGLPYLDIPTDLQNTPDLRIILAWLYILSVGELIHKHVRRSYIIRVDRLNSRIKGKLLLRRYIRESVARGIPQVSICQFYELTPDTLLNRIIKAGLHIAVRLIQQSPAHSCFNSLSGEANHYIGLLASVSDVRITNTDLARVRFNSQNRYYEPAFKWAKLLIQCRRFEYQRGELDVDGFFLDMNELFERFVAGLLKLKLPEYSVGYHNAIGVMHIYRSKEDEIGDMIPDIKLIPDILIEDRQRRIIIDAKYKELFDITEMDEEKDIVLSEHYGREKVIIRGVDIYQLLAYMANDILQSSFGALVYPCSGVEFRKTYVSGFSGKQILILGIGLSNIKELAKKELSLFPV